jgi:hypothetical protein
MFSSMQNFKPFEPYNIVQTQFTNMKTLQIFNTFTFIPNDIITINNIVLDCTDKLSELSVLYIKKITDETLSNSSIEYYKEMYNLHLELLNNIYEFNYISTEIANVLKTIASITMNQDTINFLFYEAINKYRLYNYKIIDCVKRLNVYAGIKK